MNLLTSLIVGGGPFSSAGPRVSSGVNIINVKDSHGATPGAQGDKTTDDTDAFSYWLGQLNGGGSMFIPKGQYRVRPGFNFGGNGISWIGEGSDCTTLFVDDGGAGAGGDLITMTNLRGCVLHGFNVDTLSGSARSSGRTVYIAGGDKTQQLASFGISRGGHLINIDMNNQFIGAQFDDAVNGGTTVGDWGTTIGDGSRRMWRNFAAGGTGIFYNTPHGASHVAQNLFIYTLDTVGAGPGIRYRASGDVKFIGVDCWGMGGSFVCDANAAVAAAGDALLKFTDCEFDSVASAGGPYDNFLVNFGASATGKVFIDIKGGWFAGSTKSGIHVTGTAAPLSGLVWDVGQAFTNSRYGVEVDNGTGPVGSGGTGKVLIGTTITFDTNTLGSTHYV